MKIDWFESAADFVRAHEDWRQLLQACPMGVTVFQEIDWIEACWNYPGNRLLLAIVRHEGQPIAGFVFNRERDFGSAVLWPVPLLGMTPHISNAFPASLSMLVQPGMAPKLPMRKLFTEAFHRLACTVGFFSGLNLCDPVLNQTLAALEQDADWRVHRGKSSTDAWLDISGGSQSYVAKRSVKFRQNQNRARRQLEELGLCDFLDAVQEGWSWSTIRKELVEAFERSWQVESPESPLYHTRQEATLQACERLLRSGRFHVFFYRLNGLSVAFEFGLSDAKTYYPLVRGHDKTYKKQSPGNLLAETSMDSLAQRGITQVFLGAIHLSESTKYKTHWMTRETVNENALLMRRPSLYERVDRCLQDPDSLASRLWWKLKIGERLRRHYSISG